MTTETKQKCHYCQGAENRLKLADFLEGNPDLQSQEDDHPLRDQHGNYSVTGLAALYATQAIWVNHRGVWAYFNREDFYNQETLESLDPPVRLINEWYVDDEGMDTFTQAAGAPDTHRCPESALCALGVEHHTDPVHLYINRAALNREQAAEFPRNITRIDQLTFDQAARLLRDVPELLGECTCPDGK